MLKQKPGALVLSYKAGNLIYLSADSPDGN
jgi:hypothetical protein